MPESIWAQVRNDPATKALLANLGSYAGAQAGSLAGKVAGGGKSGDAAEGAVTGMTEATKKGKSGLFGGIKGALKGLIGGSAKRPTNIYEQLFIGVPVDVAYEKWTEYSKFPEYMKGPESVKENDDGTTQWTAKIFLNRRSWKATVTEDVENYLIRWNTEAAKGTIDGCVTFTSIGDTATLMVYTLEYRPKGFFEWWGNRWRTVGRRARLDVKHFGRYVMMLDGDPTSRGHEGITEDEEPGDGPVVEESPKEPEEPKEPEPVKRTEREPRKPRTPRSPRG